MFRKKLIVSVATMMALVGTSVPALAAESETITDDTKEVLKNAGELDSSISLSSDFNFLVYSGFGNAVSPPIPSPVYTFDKSTNTVTFKDYISITNVGGNSYNLANYSAISGEIGGAALVGTLNIRTLGSGFMEIDEVSFSVKMDNPTSYKLFTVDVQHKDFWGSRSAKAIFTLR